MMKIEQTSRMKERAVEMAKAVFPEAEEVRFYEKDNDLRIFLPEVYDEFCEERTYFGFCERAACLRSTTNAEWVAFQVVLHLSYERHSRSGENPARGYQMIVIAHNPKVD